MEMLTTTHKSEATAIASSPNIQALGKTVRQLSLAGNAGFPLSDDIILAYVDKIKELAPELTPNLLQKLINKMITGELPYDPNKGLRNIFEGYKEHVRCRAYFTVVNIKEPNWVELSEDDDPTPYTNGDWRIIDGRANCKTLDRTPAGIHVPVDWMNKEDYYLSDGYQKRIGRK